MKKILLFLITIILSGCSVTEDCFKKTGNFVQRTFETEMFDKVHVGGGISLIIKQGEEQNVIVSAGENLIDNIKLSVVDGLLKIEDDTSCNWVRDYGQTTVYITTPDLTLINSKTEQFIRSEGVLSFPFLHIISFDMGGEAGTGDFDMDLNIPYLVVESNNASAFYLRGSCQNLVVSFYAGNGKFRGEHLIAQTISVFQRGNNDMELFPTESIEGNIYGTGNIILRNTPPIIDVTEHYTGRLILDD